MRRLSAVLLVALAVAGCKKSEPPPPPQPETAGGVPGGPAPAGAITGKVLERLDAPPYSYLRLETAAGEVWAAVPKTDVAKGAGVTVEGPMPMEKFESKTLGRKWDLVYFGTLAGAGAQAAGPAGTAPGMPPGMPPPGMMPPGGGRMEPGVMAAQHAAAAAGPEDTGEIKVARASGADARTVAETWAQRTQIKDKSVSIRGKVVKFNENIMGKNWVHLRDGTGAAGKDNDITVTTGDKVAVGDVVTARGTVRVDKDFGAGYAYPVIVEDAKLSK
ncbi:MAG TPA: OB-fold nucleic acid binding domain-containing protein [Anaeromyxobacteraceae bacterium]|nr:OB-fold nucleic acid binding domain-containing protein [Anaeromyxobacteraceae bacterium]